MPLQSPPEGCYETLDISIASIQSFALSRGYGIKKGRSRTIGNRTGVETKDVDPLCVDGGKHKLKDNRVGKTTTARTDCPFKVNIKNDNYGEWIIEVKNGNHNHNATDNVAAYSLRKNNIRL
jgi:hypothetical protein